MFLSLTIVDEAMRLLHRDTSTAQDRSRIRRLDSWVVGLSNCSGQCIIGSYAFSNEAGVGLSPASYTRAEVIQNFHVV